MPLWTCFFGLGDAPRALVSVELLGNSEDVIQAAMDTISLQVTFGRLVLVGSHEAAALPMVLDFVVSLPSFTHLTVFSGAFATCAPRTRLPPSLKSLAVLRFFHVGPTDLIALAGTLEESARLALEDVSIAKDMGESGIEKADKISFNRIQA